MGVELEHKLEAMVCLEQWYVRLEAAKARLRFIICLVS